MLKKIGISKRDIVSGTIGSLIATGIIATGVFIINTAPAFGSTFIGTINNYTYASTATYGSYKILFAFALLFFTCFIGILIRIVQSIISDIIKEYKATRDIDKANIDNGSMNEQGKAKRKKQSGIGSGIIIIIQGIVIFVYLAIVVFTLFVIPATLTNAFNRDIQYIRPYVEEEVVIKLESDWVVMRSEDDYKAIYSVINKVKDEHLEKR